MSKRIQNWWVPVASFGVAVALALLAGPVNPAKAFRAAQATTGDCSCIVGLAHNKNKEDKGKDDLGAPKETKIGEPANFLVIGEVKGTGCTGRLVVTATKLSTGFTLGTAEVVINTTVAAGPFRISATTPAGMTDPSQSDPCDAIVLCVKLTLSDGKECCDIGVITITSGKEGAPCNPRIVKFTVEPESPDPGQNATIDVQADASSAKECVSNFTLKALRMSIECTEVANSKETLASQAVGAKPVEVNAVTDKASKGSKVCEAIIVQALVTSKHTHKDETETHHACAYAAHLVTPAGN